jgi:hypothetical protein
MTILVKQRKIKIIVDQLWIQECILYKINCTMSCKSLPLEYDLFQRCLTHSPVATGDEWELKYDIRTFFNDLI